ncbi:conserved hypothetical protein [Ricinus communis]|uniref:Uncharacterized protein n=1 Tax=Ricinus communis TaxID=3988 RepID=B9RP38_RICCO|nr:conserved hypothetical protein [Ricinus communis]
MGTNMVSCSRKKRTLFLWDEEEKRHGGKRGLKGGSHDLRKRKGKNVQWQLAQLNRKRGTVEA